MDEKTLRAKKVAELREIAAALKLTGFEKLKKAELLELLLNTAKAAQEADAKAAAEQAARAAESPGEAKAEPVATEEKSEAKTEAKYDRKTQDRPEVEGILDIAEGGFGFLRFHNFLTSERDVYVSPTQIRRFNLKTGDKILGISRRPNEGEKFGALLYVKTVNDDEPGAAIRRPDFDSLTPIFPRERLSLEDGTRDLSMRLIGGAHRKGAAGFDRSAAEGWKNRTFEKDCRQHRKEISQGRANRAAGGRAAGGGYRYAALHWGRSDLLHF